MRLDKSTAANQTFKISSSSETNEGNTLKSTHFQKKLSTEHHSDPPMTLLHSPNTERKDKRNHSVKKEKKKKSDRKEDKADSPFPRWSHIVETTSSITPSFR